MPRFVDDGYTPWPYPFADPEALHARYMPLYSVGPCPAGNLNHVVWVDSPIIEICTNICLSMLSICRYMPLYSVGPHPIGGFIS